MFDFGIGNPIRHDLSKKKNVFFREMPKREHFLRRISLRVVSLSGLRLASPICALFQKIMGDKVGEEN